MAKRGPAGTINAGTKHKKRKRDNTKVIRPDAALDRHGHDSDDADDMREYAGFAKFLGDLRPEELQTQTRWSAKAKVKRDQLPRMDPVKANSPGSSVPGSDVDSDVSIDGDDDDDDEELDEGKLVHRMRETQSRQREVQRRLPIKLSDGTLHAAEIKRERVVDEPQSPSEDDGQVTVAQDASRASVDTPHRSEQDTLNDILERLARTASSIVEDPEEHYEKLSTLWTLHESSSDPAVRKFALMTLTSVFKDIIPGYRIRSLSDAEMAEKVTKEVRRLRAFEQGLLSYYAKFVKRLLSLWRAEKGRELASVAISAACAMLSSHAHFNLSTDLLGLLVECVCRTPDADVDAPTHIDQCHQTLQEVCSQDEEGETTLEIARLLCKRIKERFYKVPARAIDIFLCFRMANELQHRASTTRLDAHSTDDPVKVKVKKKDRQFRNKKERKTMREQKEIEREMQEASTAVDLELRERAQGETLKLVFALYLHLLRDGPRRNKTAALLGLTRFSHLVNLDLFGDLLEILKELIADAVGVPESGNEDLRNDHYILLCISTALRLLAGQPSTKETVALDLSPFVHQLYRICTSLCLDQQVQPLLEVNEARAVPFKERPEDSTTITLAETLVRCLNVVLFERRAPGHVRTLAFAKRMLISSLGVSDERAAFAMLSLVERIKARDSASRLRALFNAEDMVVGEGRFDPEQDNYELSNAASTLGFEACLLTKHFAPQVRDVTHQLLKSE